MTINLPCYENVNNRSTIFTNPDQCTSAGVVAQNYKRFVLNFWIDRILIILTVWVPAFGGIFLLIYHLIVGVAKCSNELNSTNNDVTPSNSFIDRACGLQLTTDVLQGSVKYVPNTILKSSNMNHRSPEVELSTLRLQHEFYPVILIILSILMWLPHYFYNRAIDRTARRDLCLVRSELHSFRKAITQELNYLQTIAAVSSDTVMPTTTMMSPISTFQQNVVFHRPNGNLQNGTSSRTTTAATAGGTSMFTHITGPTVINAHQRSATLGTTRVEHAETRASPVVPPVNYGDADLSAPGLIDLPCFQTCHADWSLNTYLAAWQNTDFYFLHYLTKHVVLGVFELCAVLLIFTITGKFKGAPFAALFLCNIDSKEFVCMLQTTFIINMSIVCLGLLNVTCLVLQILYFYSNFVDPFWNFTSDGSYMGVPKIQSNFLMISLDESRRCFFADYIRLMAYTAFRDSHCEIRTLSVTYSTRLYRSDFHFISLLCIENANLFPDSIHIHYWTERYARLCRKQFRKPYWVMRRGSLAHLVRCEDLSMKFNFSKINIKVEVNDFIC